MRFRVVAALLLPAAVLALPAYASFGGHKDDDQPPPTSPSQSTSSTPSMSAHDQAAQWYAKAYDVVNKGKEDLANGKDKNAKKKFKDGYSRGEEIVATDSTYHEAWNLMGYTARQLGWFDKSLDAYQHCLRIKPDYAPAHEYLGETYIELKQLDKAKEQLAALESLNATDDANTLRTAIAAYEKANPTTAAGSGSN